MTRQVTDGLYIDLEYFTPEEYYVYVAEAQAALGTAFTADISAEAGAIKDAAVSMSVAVSQTTVASRIVDAQAPLGTAFTSTMTVDALRITEVTMIVNTQMTTDAVANRSTAITLDTLAALDAQNDRIRDTDFEGADAVFDITATASATLGTSAVLSANVSQTTVAGTIKSTTASAASSFAIQAQGNRVTRPGTNPTTVNNLEISTAQARFGVGSAREVTASTQGSVNFTGIEFKDTNWTIDQWLYVTSGGGGQSDDILFNVTSPTASTTLRIERRSATGDDITMRVTYETANAGVVTSVSSSQFFIGYDQWQHYRFVYENGQLSVYVGGVRRLNTSFTIRNLTASRTARFEIGNDKTGRVYLDECRVYSGAVNPATDSSITVPTQAFVNDTNTLLLYHFDTDFLDDNIEVFRTGSAALQSQASLTAQGTVILGTAVAINSELTQTAQATVIRELDPAGYDAEFNLDIDYTRIIPADITMDVIATQLTAAGRVGNILVDIQSQSQFTASAEIIADGQITAPCEFTQVIDSDRIRDTDFEGADAVFSLSVDADVIRETALSVSSAFAQTTVNDRIRDTDFDGADAVFTQTITANAVLGLEAGLDSAFDQTVDYTRIREFSTEFDSTATQLTAAAKVGNTLVLCESQFALAVTGEVSTGAVIQANSDFALTATGGLVKSAETALSTAAALTAQPEVVIVSEALLDSAFTLSAQAQEISDFIVFETATSSLAVTASVIRAISVVANTTATQTTETQRIREFTANLPTIASQLTLGSEQSSAQAQLTARFTLTVAVAIINIDPDLTYVIPREIRSHSIAEELREDIVIPELRSYTVIKELRQATVANTDETYII